MQQVTKRTLKSEIKVDIFHSLYFKCKNMYKEHKIKMLLSEFYVDLCYAEHRKVKFKLSKGNDIRK